MPNSELEQILMDYFQHDEINALWRLRQYLSWPILPEDQDYILTKLNEPTTNIMANIILLDALKQWGMPGLPAYNEAVVFTTTQTAAKTHMPQAMNFLGVLYDRQGNMAEAVKWLQKAKEANYGLAYLNLAKLYELGKGVPANENTALNLLAQVPQSAQAHYYLGIYYQTHKTPKKMWQHFRTAADMGFGAAALFIMKHSVDDAEVMKYADIAARVGNVKAPLTLAMTEEPPIITLARTQKAQKKATKIAKKPIPEPVKKKKPGKKK